MRRTLWNPYSVVSKKAFGRPSQEITSPFSSAFFRKSRVLWEVDVLSISKIPIMDVSRTAISLPIDKYIVSSPRLIVGGGALDAPPTTISNCRIGSS